MAERGPEPEMAAADYFARDMPEDQLLQLVRTRAAACGWLVYHTRDSRGSDAGFPDLVLLRGLTRELLFVELKRERGLLTPDQAQWLDDLRVVANGARGKVSLKVHVWRPRDWFAGDIEEALR